jgi:hypothetical protein
MTTDDNVKKQLVDRLSEEPPMVLATAYAYAKNYVNYGEDITKAWTTAVQQASILEQVRQKTWVEAYDSFKADYENRLKADMVAMLEELDFRLSNYQDTDLIRQDIQQKINALKRDQERKE